MQFVIDEKSWNFNGLGPAKCIEALELILDQIDDAHAEGHSICYSEDLFNTPVWQNKSFYELYSPESSLYISREVQERIASTFSLLLKWQDINSEWPTTFAIQVGDQPLEEAPSVAWAHKQTTEDPLHPVACLVFQGGRPSGFFSVKVDEKNIDIWFLSEKKEYYLFFRWLITSKTSNHTEMAKYASSAFSSLDFVEGAFIGIRNMKKPYIDIVDALVHHLSVLSDEGKRIFQGRRQDIVSEFGSLGVNISDENGNTRSDRLARKERTIRVNGVDTLFWWHTKLEPHQNRIHFNPDKIGNGGRLLIGIFCDHLK